MKIVDSRGITEDALSLQIEKINNEVKRLLDKERSKYENETLDYLNFQLDGLLKLINMGYKIEFDDRQSVNSLDLHLVLDNVLKARFCKYGAEKDKLKFVLSPHYLYTGSLSYFRSKLDPPNKVKVQNATKAKIDKWIHYSKQYIAEVDEYEQKLENNKIESLKTIETLKLLPNVRVTDQENRIYFNSLCFELMCEFNGLNKLTTRLNLKHRLTEDIELFTKLYNGGF